MRTVVGTFIYATALASQAFASPETPAPLPTYHLHGYYRDGGVLELSDDNPWQVVSGEPWIAPRVVKWGWMPVTHDSKNYYCWIKDMPIVGSNIARKTLDCKDAETLNYSF